MKLSLLPKTEAILRPGDIFRGYYFPTVLPGRSEAYRNDIELIIKNWISKCDNLFSFGFSVIHHNQEPQKLNVSAFDLFAQIFKEMNFSLIHVKTELEDDLVCWHILCGVWADEFKKCVSSIKHSTGYIFLLCLIYYSQYKSRPSDQFPNPIPISLDTFNITLDIMEKSENLNLDVQIRSVLTLMMNDKAFTFTCRDGPNYYYQNRIGNPLPIKKDLLISRKFKLFRTNLTTLSENVDKPFKKMRNCFYKILNNSDQTDNNNQSNSNSTSILFNNTLQNFLKNAGSSQQDQKTEHFTQISENLNNL